MPSGRPGSGRGWLLVATPARDRDHSDGVLAYAFGVFLVPMSRHPAGPASRHLDNRPHWQLDFPGDDLEAMRAFRIEVDHHRGST